MQGASLTLNAVIFNVYLAEVAPSKIRGRVILAQQLAFTVEILIAGVVSLGYVKTGDWQGMFNCILFILVLLLIFSFLLLKSPRCLALNRKFAEDKYVFRKLNCKLSEEELNRECQALEESGEVKKGRKAGLVELYLNPKYIKPILNVLGLYVFDQLTGVKAIFQTSVVILQDTGINSAIVGVLGSVFIAGMNFAMTIVTMIFVDKIGRKTILKIGVGGFGVVTLFMGIMLYILPDG